MNSLSQRLISWAKEHPILAPTLVGLFVRLLTALLGLGFHARDDYFHVLEPALHWVADPLFDWDNSTLAGAGLRSHLVPRLVSGLILGCHSIGIENPTRILQVLYATLGLYSTLVIPGSYLLGRELFKTPDNRFASTILWVPWLMALHFAMPYSGTRLLIEAMAMPPLVWGLYYCAYSNARSIILGGFLIGLGCWFRFHLGAATIGLALFIAFRETKNAPKAIACLALGGASAVVIQGLYDLYSTGQFLGPVIRNIQYNANPPGELSRSNPAAYIGFWLLLTVPPATFLLLPPLWKSFRAWGLVSWPWLSFTVLHSLVGHKEERFMIPVLPLFLIMLAPLPILIRDWSEGFGKILRRFWPMARNYLWVLHTVALVLVIGNQSQKNLRDAMLELRPNPQLETIISLGPETQSYFLGRPKVAIHRNRKFDAIWLKHVLDSVGKLTPAGAAIISFAQDRPKVGIILMAEGLQCAPPKELRGWWLDRLVYKLNPRRNVRRSPVDIWRCSYQSFATNTTRLSPEVFHAQAPLYQND